MKLNVNIVINFLQEKIHWKKHIDKTCKNKSTLTENIIYKKLLNKIEEQGETVKEIKKKDKEQEKEINMLKKQIEKIKNNTTSIGDNSNNNNSNNVNIINNITIIEFGKENLDEISDDVIKYCISRGFNSIPKLVEYVHFNKNNPKHHNVYIPNMRNDFALTFTKENKWDLSNQSEVIDELFDDKSEHLLLKFEEFYDVLDEATKRKFEKYLDKNEDDYEINKIN